MRAGEVIGGKYRLERRLGLGGMGAVWLAVHTQTERQFAIKIMHPHIAASQESRQRFGREARASGRIQHPGVIDVFDVGETPDGSIYLVMELLDGLSLHEAFDTTPALTLREFCWIAAETAGTLAAAHRAGVIHRDIKPANIFLHRSRVTQRTHVKLLDFGISKFSAAEDGYATTTGSVVGSPRYMSPEQTRSAASTDARSDLWALGVILFEGLTGRYPHVGDSYSSLVLAIASAPPASIDEVAPDAPEALRAVIRRCLQPVDLRYQSASELRDDLAEVLKAPGLDQVHVAYEPRGRKEPRPSIPSNVDLTALAPQEGFVTRDAGGDAGGIGTADPLANSGRAPTASHPGVSRSGSHPALPSEARPRPPEPLVGTLSRMNVTSTGDSQARRRSSRRTLGLLATLMVVLGMGLGWVAVRITGPAGVEAAGAGSAGVDANDATGVAETAPNEDASAEAGADAVAPAASDSAGASATAPTAEASASASAGPAGTGAPAIPKTGYSPPPPPPTKEPKGAEDKLNELGSGLD